MKTPHSDKAVELFKSGCNCAQAVATAFAPSFGFSKDDTMRLTCGLGGGLGRLRETCGAVSGMAIVAGMRYGNTEPKDPHARKVTYEVVQRMAAEFREQNDSIICRELLGLTAPDNNPTPDPRTREYYARRPCANLVRCAAEIVEKHLVDNSD